MNVDQRLTKHADVQEQAPVGINIWVNRGNTRRMQEYGSRRIDVTIIAISNRHLDIMPLRVSGSCPIIQSKTMEMSTLSTILSRSQVKKVSCVETKPERYEITSCLLIKFHLIAPFFRNFAMQSDPRVETVER